MPLLLSSQRVIPSVACVKHLRRAVGPTSRNFSTTNRAEARMTRARRQFFFWLATKGANFKNPLPGSTNYLGAYNANGELKRVVQSNRAKALEKEEEEAAKAAGRRYTPPAARPAMPKETPDHPTKVAKQEKFKQNSADKGSTGRAPVSEELPPEFTSDLVPFPQNRAFISQPVLSDKFRKKIWEAVMLEGKTVREVSAEYRVEMSRVGAVVRLIEVQKEWQRIGKPLATPYHKAVMNMLPKTLYLEDQPEAILGKQPHESINDLPVHRSTGQQIFYPTSESRVFTRVDAAKAFHEKLLPADDRVPHPELAIMYKEKLDGLLPGEIKQRAAARQGAKEQEQARIAVRRAKEEARVKKIDTGRWEYRFEDINVDRAGKDGRGSTGVGWRYGAPHMDRSRGKVKIPTAV